MAKRKSLQHDDCPVARAVDLVGDRWSMLIIRDAMDGISRFGDFQRNLGVARNILSDRLSALVEAGLLAIQPAADGSAYQQYVLTSKGESLFPAIVALLLSPLRGTGRRSRAFAFLGNGMRRATVLTRLFPPE